MKRFTATEKWDKVWHRKLPCRIKCFWDYICAKCNAIGVWEPDFDVASLQIGEPVTRDDIRHFEGRIKVLKNDNWLVVSFLGFQCGEVSQTCPAHKPIIKLLNAYPEVSNTLSNSLSNRLQEKEKEKDKVQEKEKDKDLSTGGYGGEPVEKPRHETVGGFLDELGSKLYARPKGQWPTDTELRYALIVTARPGWELERDRILAFGMLIAPADRRFQLPLSLERLLEDWSPTLDKARTYRPSERNSPPVNRQRHQEITVPILTPNATTPVAASPKPSQSIFTPKTTHTTTPTIKTPHNRS